jgi:hypothetical protein
VPQEASQPAPAVIHFCWTNCFTLQWNDGRYSRVDGSEETWTIERFTPRSFVLHRHDAPAAWNNFNADVLYEGRVSDDRLINVAVAGNPVPNITAAWGSALHSVPGSNAERDRPRLEPAPDPELRAVVAPPPLPDDAQPPCPADGYLWTPGYWGWRAAGYYWVPGLWVQPPRVGVLWTPGYWGFVGTVYVFHPGYWGPHVGYYGGINYGHGYVGVGFAGGRWVGNAFAYNSAVANVNVSLVHNLYREPVVAPALLSKASYNGGPGGTVAVPTAQEQAAAAEAHMPPPTGHIESARRVVASTQKAAAFHAPPATDTHHSPAPAPAPAGRQLVARSVSHVNPPAPAPTARPAGANPAAAASLKSAHSKR